MYRGPAFLGDAELAKLICEVLSGIADLQTVVTAPMCGPCVGLLGQGSVSELRGWHHFEGSFIAFPFHAWTTGATVE